MREILFRGKRVDNGEWVYGDIAHIEDRVFVSYYNNCELKQFINDEVTSDNITLVGIFPFVEVVPETVGQYTGLTDKNDKKIFEGDIVEYTYCLGTLYQILWVQRGYGHKEIGTGIVEQFATDYSGEPTKLKATIKGNIYDNPELLEVE